MFGFCVTDMRGSLSDQLTETSNAKILRLELENQRLSAKLREMQEGAVIHSAEVNLQLEKENQRLVKRIEKLQESAQVGYVLNSARVGYIVHSAQIGDMLNSAQAGHTHTLNSAQVVSVE